MNHGQFAILVTSGLVSLPFVNVSLWLNIYVIAKSGIGPTCDDQQHKQEKCQAKYSAHLMNGHRPVFIPILGLRFLNSTLYQI